MIDIHLAVDCTAEVLGLGHVEECQQQVGGHRHGRRGEDGGAGQLGAGGHINTLLDSGVRV